MDKADERCAADRRLTVVPVSGFRSVGYLEGARPSVVAHASGNARSTIEQHSRARTPEDQFAMISSSVSRRIYRERDHTMT